MSNNIPDWNEIGVLPPINELNPISPSRSPYKTTTVELVRSYSFNKQRIKILSGFLEFRREIYQIGITEGFQWIDGSFTENIELTESRPPNDIDVVTFFHIPIGETQQSIIMKKPDLFSWELPALDWRKNQLKIDSYWQPFTLEFEMDSLASLLERTVYWYSMWSHKRDLSWKGFLQIPLSYDDDVNALNLLNEIILEGSNEQR